MIGKQLYQAALRVDHLIGKLKQMSIREGERVINTADGFHAPQQLRRMMVNFIKKELITNTKVTVWTPPAPPPWSSPCCSEGAYPPTSSNQSVLMRRAQLSIAAKVVRRTDLFNNVKS